MTDDAQAPGQPETAPLPGEVPAIELAAATVAYDGPPRFRGGVRLDRSFPTAYYHAFTGRVVRAGWGEPLVLITETLP